MDSMMIFFIGGLLFAFGFGGAMLYGGHNYDKEQARMNLGGGLATA